MKGEELRYWALTMMVVLVQITAMSASAAEDEAISRYIETYKDIAINEMHDHGVPASIKLAQAIFESNAGRSHLAVRAKNHFGIKCGRYWDGPTVMREDDDYLDGKLVKSCFRAYPEVAASYEAHSEFLLDPKKDFRYGFLFKLDRTDYEAWARGLKKAGYATNPKYPQRLISLIERYGLYAYDHMPRPLVLDEDYLVMKTQHPARETTIVALEKPEGKGIKTEDIADEHLSEETRSDDNITSTYNYSIAHENGVPYVVSQGDEELEAIATSQGYDLGDIIAANEFIYGRTQRLEGAQRIYLAKKKRRFKGGRNYHRVGNDESVFDIAQRYGIQEKSLRKLNRWSKSYQPLTGERVYLKRKKPKSKR